MPPERVDVAARIAAHARASARAPCRPSCRPECAAPRRGDRDSGRDGRARNRSAPLRRSARYITLVGFRSRCTTSCRWISCSASASAAPRRAISSGGTARVEPIVQPHAFDEFHDQIRRGLDVAVRHERRMVGALRERAQHHAAHLEADDVHGALPGAEPRNLHDERQRAVGARQAVDRRHAADVDHLAEAEAVDLAARLRADSSSRPRSRRSASRSGSPAARIFRIVDVVVVGERERTSAARVRGRRARSTPRCCRRAAGRPSRRWRAIGDACAVGIGVPGTGSKRHRPPAGTHVIELLLVHVAAEDVARLARAHAVLRLAAAR